MGIWAVNSNRYGREDMMQIKVENVTKKIGQAMVLNQINMELESGTIYGLKLSIINI